MAKQNFREIGMDTMERLYYERKDMRKKAYAARQRKASSRNRRTSMKNPQIYESATIAFDPASCGAI